MVQESGSKVNTMNAYSAVSRKEAGNMVDPAGRKESQFGVKQQYNSSKSYSAQQNNNNKNDSAQKYGAWGPVFKNKDNFASMHLF